MSHVKFRPINISVRFLHGERRYFHFVTLLAFVLRLQWFTFAYPCVSACVKPCTRCLRVLEIWLYTHTIIVVPASSESLLNSSYTVVGTVGRLLSVDLRYVYCDCLRCREHLTLLVCL